MLDCSHLSHPVNDLKNFQTLPSLDADPFEDFEPLVAQTYRRKCSRLSKRMQEPLLHDSGPMQKLAHIWKPNKCWW